MDLTLTSNHSTWADWIAHNPDAADDVKLAALREYIWLAARDGHLHEPGKLTAAWVDKKLGPLGVTKRLGGDNEYVLKVPVNVDPITTTIHAQNRNEAVQLFMKQFAASRVVCTGVEAASDPEFVSGPEDATLGQVHPDAPTTVDATLVALREAILLAVVAGPRICVDGANDALITFGLPDVPERVEYVVVRPATASARTVVTAYDKVSARRVADWRWENNRSGYSVEVTGDAGDYTVREA